MWNIIFLGLVSFFADISSQMVYPIIPLYLTSTFGATPALVGIIEGIAESTASLLKVFSGYVTDKYKKKKPISFLGYATGLIYKLALLLASSWVGILTARVIDRLGKGIRTSPRDVMVSESADKNEMGKAFGVHKALDMAGSALGILFAYFLLKNMVGSTADYKFIFAISAIPSVIALFMFFFIKEKKENRVVKKREQFWKISDKIGRKKLLTAGYLTFAVVYLGFGFSQTSWMFIALFVLYGTYTAMSAGVERALISEIAPANLKGTMLGLHSTIAGIALLPASVICGFLWNSFGATIPFVFGAMMSIVAALLLICFFDRKTAQQV